ncbi:MAG: hypothetical protein BGP12_06470 [Rhodospirillales bacterium 70-18]|nr:MAG: hypothetical protein BGP12_06470 [Rhodospirillales bacterium 70-18]
MSSAAPPTILVVDDRKDVAATLAELCRTLGFAAVVGEEGSDIRTQLERLSPAALIIDVMMPDQDGYEALKEIAAFNPGLPVLLVTGYGETWLRMGATLGRAHGLRALQTASKPVRTDTVRRFLATLSAPA